MAHSLRRDSGDYQILVALLVLWTATGTNFLGFKIALDEIPPFSLAAVRVLSAAAILALPLLLRAEVFRPRKHQIISCAIAAVFFVILGQGVVVAGMQGLNSGQVALIMSCVPMLSVALEAALFRRWPKRETVLALGIGLAGLLLIVRGSAGASATMVPLLLVLLGAVGWAFGTILSARLHMPRDTLEATFLQFLSGGLVLAVLAGLMGESSAWVTTAARDTYLALVWVIVIGSVLGFGSFVFLRERVDHALANSFFYTSPVIALALGAAIRGERFSTLELIGGSLAVLGVVLIVRSSMPSRPSGPSARS